MVKSAQLHEAKAHQHRHSGEGWNPMKVRNRGILGFASPNVIGPSICATGIVSKDKPPLPLGEGWGEGMQAAKSQPSIPRGKIFFELKSKVIPRSFPHPGPFPEGEGENTFIANAPTPGRRNFTRAAITHTSKIKPL
jgi:hypothetical protein